MRVTTFITLTNTGFVPTLGYITLSTLMSLFLSLGFFFGKQAALE